MVLSYTQQTASIDELKAWNNQPNINPRSQRKIKSSGLIYQTLKKQYQIYQTKLSNQSKKAVKISDTIKKSPNKLDQKPKVDKYQKYRKNKIDPILLEQLPLHKKWKAYIFQFPDSWDPYTGIRNGKDKDGPLCFDPDALIYFFYTNRLRHLWQHRDIQDADQQFQETYGDAVGKAPEFNIPGRGKHPDWYLFRLPIIDAYLPSDHCYQAVTMGPILTNEEIDSIQNFAEKQGNNYFKTYGQERPDLRLIKKYYDQAVTSFPQLNIDPEVLPFLEENEPEYIAQLKYNINISGVEKLRFMK